jgi:hypothetical protein
MSSEKPWEDPMHDPHLDVARQQLGLSYMDLWVHYFALGGYLDVGGLTDHLHGDRSTTTTEHNTIVHALNEVFRDRGQDNPVAYRAR